MHIERVSIQLRKKKRYLAGSCRNITNLGYCISRLLCRVFFRVCAEMLVLGEIFTSCMFGHCCHSSNHVMI